MQTFLPYPSYAKSAEVLDRARLGKQRVEGYQILKVLAGESKGWQNHPAVKMWKGHEKQLIAYIEAICDEWTKRGYKDTVKEKIQEYKDKFSGNSKPPFIGRKSFHDAHKSSLLRKDEYYKQFKWTVPNNLPYEWS